MKSTRKKPSPSPRHGTVAIAQLVKAAYTPDQIRAAILAQGYAGDGSMDDAGCIESAFMGLDWDLRNAPRPTVPQNNAAMGRQSGCSE